FVALRRLPLSSTPSPYTTLFRSISGLLRVLPLPKEPVMVVSGASGAHAATGAERSALASAGEFAIRGFGSLTGHLKEAQFPFAIDRKSTRLNSRHGKNSYTVFCL